MNTIMMQNLKAKILATILLLATGVLLGRAVDLAYQKRQHDLRLKLVEHDLDAFWQKIDRTETPTVIVDGQSVDSQSIEMQRLWGNQEQAEKEHRQEIVKLINEQRRVVNEQTPDVYPLLELEPHPMLEQSARQAFENIAKTKRFEHQDMTALLTRGEPFDTVGENLAAENYVNPVRVVYDWYLSEVHKEVMLGDWSHIGVWSGWIEDLTEKEKGTTDRYVTVAHFGE
ncbi:MAG: CAP domain-containing protein [Crenarchaeota archaeon]|nr:CAP domain-containing protein [Thermoproteota archaeon]